jgi:hypothetical protein
MYGLLALKGVLMIVSVLVSIKEIVAEIVAEGRDFPWPRPKDGKSKLEALQAAREDIRREGYIHAYF